jgi:GAF domain-containing protein
MERQRAASSLRGTTVAMGDRLTGWVGANRQCIMNSDAALDLGAKAEGLLLQSCMSVPLLMGESLVGVLSLYAPSLNGFADDCGRLIQMVAPHIAGAIHAAHPDAKTRSTAEKSGGGPLRLVATH